MLALLAAAAATFQQPSTPESFRRYLLGEWTLRKAINYKEGGVSGTFSGSATFSLLDAEKPGSWGLVAYNERGVFTPKQSNFQERETRNALLYDFSETAKADVFYDMATDRGNAEDVLRQASYLYSLTTTDVGTLGIAQTSSGAESYSGSIEAEAPNAFISTWRVAGPGVDGEIASLYRRVDEMEDIREDRPIDVDVLE